MWKTAFKKSEEYDLPKEDHTPSNSLKAVFHKLC